MTLGDGWVQGTKMHRQDGPTLTVKPIGRVIWRLKQKLTVSPPKWSSVQQKRETKIKVVILEGWKCLQGIEHSCLCEHYSISMESPCAQSFKLIPDLHKGQAASFIKEWWSYLVLLDRGPFCETTRTLCCELRMILSMSFKVGGFIAPTLFCHLHTRIPRVISGCQY